MDETLALAVDIGENVISELRLDDGKLADLALKFDDDPDTGLYLKSTNTLALVANATEQMNIADGTITFAANLNMSSNNITNIGNIVSGSYTPTTSNNVNLDTNPTVNVAHYYRIGDRVQIFINAVLDVTTTATLTSFDITLPVARSNFTTVYEAIGHGVRRDDAQWFHANSVVGAQTIRLSTNGVDTGAKECYVSISYEL